MALCGLSNGTEATRIVLKTTSITDSGASPLANTAMCLNDWQNSSSLVRWRLERWVFLGLVCGISGVLVVLAVAIAMLSGKSNKKKQKAQ